MEFYNISDMKADLPSHVFLVVSRFNSSCSNPDPSACDADVSEKLAFNTEFSSMYTLHEVQDDETVFVDVYSCAGGDCEDKISTAVPSYLASSKSDFLGQFSYPVTSLTVVNASPKSTTLSSGIRLKYVVDVSISSRSTVTVTVKINAVATFDAPLDDVAQANVRDSYCDAVASTLVLNVDQIVCTISQVTGRRRHLLATTTTYDLSATVQASQDQVATIGSDAQSAVEAAFLADPKVLAANGDSAPLVEIKPVQGTLADLALCTQTLTEYDAACADVCASACYNVVREITDFCPGTDKEAEGKVKQDTYQLEELKQCLVYCDSCEQYYLTREQACDARPCTFGCRKHMLTMKDSCVVQSILPITDAAFDEHQAIWDQCTGASCSEFIDAHPYVCEDICSQACDTFVGEMSTFCSTNGNSAEQTQVGILKAQQQANFTDPDCVSPTPAPTMSTPAPPATSAAPQTEAVWALLSLAAALCALV